MRTDYQKLQRSLSKVILGYVFLYSNINLGQVNLMPVFVGYLLFLSAIEGLKEEERELSLLKTLGVILALWHAFVWAMSWVSVEIEGKWLLADILISVMNIYFQFQFVTNLAAIAAKFQPNGRGLDAKLLTYRTWQTVLLTIVMLLTTFYPWLSEVWGYVLAVLGVIYVVFGFCLIKALFDLRRCVQEPQPEPGETESAASRTHVPKEESTAEAGAETD